jgi:hypothetical protein
MRRTPGAEQPVDAIVASALSVFGDVHRRGRRIVATPAVARLAPATAARPSAVVGFWPGLAARLEEGGRLADAAVLRAENRRTRGWIRRRQRLRLRLDHRQRIAVALSATLESTLVAETVVAIAALAVVAVGAVVPRAVVSGAVIALSVVARSVIPRPIVSGPVIPRTVIPRPIVSGPVIPRTVIPRTVVSGTVVSGPVIPRPIVSGAVVSGTVVAVAAAIVAVAVSLALVAPSVVSATALLAPFAPRLGVRLDRLARALDGVAAALVLEVNVEPGRKSVAAHDVAGRTLRLHRTQHAEVVLGVLLIALRQDAVAGGQRIARQLLILLEHVLSGAADLDAVGPVGLERAVGVVLRLAASAAAPIAAALPLHTFEISHVFQQSDRRSGLALISVR